MRSFIAVSDKAERCMPNRLCALGALALGPQKVWRSVAKHQTMLTAEPCQHFLARSNDVALKRWQFSRPR